ncbi:MAG: ATP-binding protein [Chloroflexi bacterium]|nr:ATP-binding protein [Chloroflexota bacterium]
MGSDMRGRAPVLVMVAGLPGAGKTTLALALGRSLGWPVLDKDTIKSALLPLGIADQVAGQASYVLLPAIARDLIERQGLSVIIDGPFVYPDIVAKVVATAAETGATLKIVLCLAGDALRNRRVVERKAVLSQWTAPRDGWPGDGSDRFAHLPDDVLRIDTTRPVAGLLAEVVAYVWGLG